MIPAFFKDGGKLSCSKMPSPRQQSCDAHQIYQLNMMDDRHWLKGCEDVNKNIGSAELYCYCVISVVTLHKTVNAFICNANTRPSANFKPCKNRLNLAFCCVLDHRRQENEEILNR